MITSLLIDGVEYLEYLLFDEINKLTFQVDEGINSPLCPIYEFSLLNRDKLEDVFLKNYPYKLYEEGNVKLYNDGVKVFDGYVDKNNSKIMKNADKLMIYAVSREKKVGVQLAEYDVTQLYYNKDGSIPVRQRGGREGITLRYDYSEYNRIDNLFATMMQDIGITRYGIAYYGNAVNEYSKYRYNEEKFGPIADKQTIGIYRNTGDRAWDSPYYNRITQYKRNETDTESYDTLLKEFSKITGTSFYYDCKLDRYLLTPRNGFNWQWAGWGTKVVIDQKILADFQDDEYEIPIRYKDAYNGIIFEFDDISLLQKFEINEGVLTYQYGVDAEEYEIRQFPNGHYYLWIDDDNYFDLGFKFFYSSLYIENGLKVKMNGKLSDYFRNGGLDPERLDLFMDILRANYTYTLLYNREIEIKLNGIYVPPFITELNGEDYYCWYGEVDFNSEETLIKIEIGDFDSVIPADVDLVMEDDVFILDL